MTPLQKQAIRTALRIHEHLTGTSRLTDLVQLPTHEWEQSAKLLQRLQLALRRGWRAASDSLLTDLEYSLRRLRTECDTCHANLPRSAATNRLAPPGEIVADILALDAEFDSLAIKLEENLLQVQTNPILLEDTAFGRFRIELRWDLIGRERAYEVIAETPNTPENDEEVSHPHVRDNLLCEGEGTTPIRRALAEGRLLDFFTLVRQILETYNPGSAYVEISRWNGVACKDCGYVMPGDGYGVCDQCEDPLCSECSVGCCRCDRYVCNGCSTTCEACERTLCESCLQSADSGRLLCPTCLEETLEEPDENECSEEDPSPNAAVCPTGAAPAHPYAWAKLIFLRDAGPTEIGGFGISAGSNLLLIEDFRLVKQCCSVATVRFDDESIADFFDEQVDQGLAPEQFGRIWVHTHPGSSPLPSVTDEETFARCFGGADWSLMLILAWRTNVCAPPLQRRANGQFDAADRDRFWRCGSRDGPGRLGAGVPRQRLG